MGIILVHSDSLGGRSYFLGKRRDSFCYVDFMRGYIDRRYIHDYIRGMTRSEQERILSETFDVLWVDLWVHHNGKPFIRDRKYAGRKFRENMRQFRSAIARCHEQRMWADDAGWIMPKGRKRPREQDLHCGIREFYEESMYPTHPSELRMVEGARFSKTHTAFTLAKYETVYYVLQTETMELPCFAIAPNTFHGSCVSDEIELCAWMTRDEACAAVGKTSVYAQMLRELDATLSENAPVELVEIPEKIIFDLKLSSCRKMGLETFRLRVPHIPLSSGGWILEN